MTEPPTSHRPDIDGLRAIAVGQIVLFHAGVGALSGGFAGVDIFFVISGFLITSIIVREQRSGDFSLASFYARRLVRILPALFAMLAVTLAAGCALLLPDELRKLAATAAAAAGSVSNIYFERTSGYFTPAAKTAPLLHTWSLGVEEQFYLFYPLFLIAVRRHAPTGLRASLAILAAFSFASSLYLALGAPEAAFYLLPSRAWELALGGLAALGAFPSEVSPRLREALAALGLVAIAAGVAVIRSGGLMPAPWMLAPCLGTALLLVYGQGARTERLLAAAPMRALGAVSYSLYLWHWPIIVFERLRTEAPLTLVSGAAAVFAAAVLASLSYVLIEQPFLRRFRAGPPIRVIGSGAAGLAALLAIAGLVHARADLWRDLPPDVRRVAAYVDYPSWPDHEAQFVEGTCFVSLGETFDRKNCLALDAGKRNMLVFGDSHAAQYWRAIALRFPGWNVMQATGAACRPMRGVSTESHCNDFVPYVLDEFLAHEKIDAIVLAGRWLKGETGKLEATIRELEGRGIAVTVIGPVVEYEGEFPRLLAAAMLRGDPHSVDRLRVADRKSLDEELERMVATTDARYFSEIEIECPNERCRLFDPDGGPFHFDYGHVTLAAARDIAAHLTSP
jgi:peptidoglycan/LPS O-acetylase OafA/YrhL